MLDPFGRSITYLRVSVTDRCDFRCVYCMAEDMTFLPKAELLTLEEMDRVCSAFVRLGVRKLRLTGGEPLVRKNVMSLIRNLSRHLKSGKGLGGSVSQTLYQFLTEDQRNVEISAFKVKFAEFLPHLKNHLT